MAYSDISTPPPKGDDFTATKPSAWQSLFGELKAWFAGRRRSPKANTPLWNCRQAEVREDRSLKRLLILLCRGRRASHHFLADKHLKLGKEAAASASALKPALFEKAIRHFEISHKYQARPHGSLLHNSAFEASVEPLMKAMCAQIEFAKEAIKAAPSSPMHLNGVRQLQFAADRAVSTGIRIDLEHELTREYEKLAIRPDPSLTTPRTINATPPSGL